MTRPLLSLVLPVKDEAKSIREVLEDVKPFIDHWTILDTGSTDGTQEIIREVMKDVPGTLYEEPAPLCTFEEEPEASGFVDFAKLRNRVLDLDQSDAVFQFMLSGDEHLRNGQALRDHLEAHRDTDVDCHFLSVFVDVSAAHNPSQRVLRKGSSWRYEGELHEIPFNREKVDAKVEAVRGAYIDHIVSDGERRFDAMLAHHIPVLKAMLHRDPQSDRALVFLAQTYTELLDHMDPREKVSHATMILGLYLRALALKGLVPVMRHYLYMRFLVTAHRVNDFCRMIHGGEGLFSAKELYVRAEALFKVDGQRPETAQLRAQLSVGVRPMEETYALAKRAAEIAESPLDVSSPSSTDCAWRSHLLAAMACKQIASKLPDRKHGGPGGTPYRELMKKHIKMGIEAGGSWEVFKLLQQEPKKEEPPTEAKFDNSDSGAA